MTVSHGRMGRRAHRDRSSIATEASSIREPFGASQMYAIAMGVFFIVLGAVGLARGGIDSMTSSQVEMLGMSMTPLLALIHLVIGVLSLASAASRSASRGMMMFLGASLIALGVIALIQPVDELGWNSGNGVAYLITGTLAIALAAMTPMMNVSERHVMVDDTTDHVA